MIKQTFTNVKLDNLEIKVSPTDILGDKITYKVEFISNDWGENVPNITCLATKISINGQEYKPFDKLKKDPVKKENKKEKKGAKKNANKK